MRIAIDISQIAYSGTGVGRFTAGLLNEILKNNENDLWTFFYGGLRNKLSTEIMDRIKSKEQRIITVPFPPRALSLFWNTMHIVPIETFVGPQDWIITSDWTEPPARTKKATIIHDLAFKRFPETIEYSILATQTKRLELVAKESRLIFADSNSTKIDLVDFYKIQQKKICVNYPGVEIKTPTTSELEQVKKHFLLTEPYILAVGKVEPRKNLKRLIEAFHALSTTNMQLVIAGPPGWDSIKITDSRIRFLGHVTDTELGCLYTMAHAFVYPSIWEGFGYPPVEAMSLGTPVAMSNNSSLKEIGHDAALLFDSNNTHEISNALTTIIENNELRKSLRQKGLNRAKEYTWKRYYEILHEQLTVNTGDCV